MDRKVQLAFDVEKQIETALLNQGCNPHRIRLKINDIRGILFFNRTTLLTESTLRDYQRECGENLYLSRPYNKIRDAILANKIIL